MKYELNVAQAYKALQNGEIVERDCVFNGKIFQFKLVDGLIKTRSGSYWRREEVENDEWEENESSILNEKFRIVKSDKEWELESLKRIDDIIQVYKQMNCPRFSEEHQRALDWLNERISSLEKEKESSNGI